MFSLFLPHCNPDVLFYTDVKKWNYGKINETKRKQEQNQCVSVRIHTLILKYGCVFELCFTFLLFVDSFLSDGKDRLARIKLKPFRLM